MLIMDNSEYSTDYSESWKCEYTTFILDLLYQLFIMDKGEYSTDYSESWKVSTQHSY